MSVGQAELSRAIVWASKIHEGKRDKGGFAYILHPLRIMMQVMDRQPIYPVCAVCHDGIEDGFETLEEGLVSFRDNVTDDDEALAAMVLLSRPKNMEYMEYILRGAPNPIFRVLKPLDLKDNSDITRLKGVTQDDLDRMKKYHRAYLFLTGRADLLLKA